MPNFKWQSLDLNASQPDFQVHAVLDNSTPFFICLIAQLTYPTFFLPWSFPKKTTWTFALKIAWPLTHVLKNKCVHPKKMKFNGGKYKVPYVSSNQKLYGEILEQLGSDWSREGAVMERVVAIDTSLLAQQVEHDICLTTELHTISRESRDEVP